MKQTLFIKKLNKRFCTATTHQGDATHPSTKVLAAVEIPPVVEFTRTIVRLSIAKD